MPDPTTPAKGLTQPTVGGDNNTWGSLLNTDLALIDSALGGTLAKSISGATTLTSTQAQNTGYEFTGTLSGTATVTWPVFYGFAAIQNGTSGGHSITCGISGGTVTVLNGETVVIWSDGTNFARLAQCGGGVGSTGTGSVVLANSPTLTTPTATTSMTTPEVLGGASSSSSLTLQSTTGSFAGADQINLETSTGIGFIIAPNATGVGGNGIRFFPGSEAGGQNPEFDAFPMDGGASANFGISFRGHGDWFHAFHSTTAAETRIKIYPASNDTDGVYIAAPLTIVSGGYYFRLPGTPNGTDAVLYDSDGTGNLSFGTPISVARAVVQFNGSTATINAGYGVSGVVRNSTGNYTITLSSATTDGASAVSVCANGGGTPVVCTFSQPDLTHIQVWTNAISGASADPTAVSVIVHR